MDSSHNLSSHGSARWRASERSQYLGGGIIDGRFFFLTLLFDFIFSNSLIRAKHLQKSTTEVFLPVVHIHRQDQLPLRAFDFSIETILPQESFDVIRTIATLKGKAT